MLFPNGHGPQLACVNWPWAPCLEHGSHAPAICHGAAPSPSERPAMQPLGCHISALSDCMHSDYDCVVGFLGHLSAIFFFVEYVATYTMGCSLLPPVWYACHWPGGPAMNKVNDLSTRDVATRCSTCFL